MGAWGSGILENDTAADWIADLRASGDAALVVEAFAVLAEQAEGLLDPDAVLNALAAAEVVAAALGRGIEPSVKDVAGLVAVAERDAGYARFAVDLACRPDDNELRELWVDAATADEWSAAVDDLRVRLGDGPAVSPPAEAAAAAAARRAAYDGDDDLDETSLVIKSAGGLADVQDPQFYEEVVIKRVRSPDLSRLSEFNRVTGVFIEEVAGPFDPTPLQAMTAVDWVAIATDDQQTAEVLAALSWADMPHLTVLMLEYTGSPPVQISLSWCPSAPKLKRLELSGFELREVQAAAPWLRSPDDGWI